MGWFGHGIYDGDDTQTRHIDFIKWAKIDKNEDEICDWISSPKTKIPKDKAHLLLKNVELILKKMPKVPKFWNEDHALEWQMLLALFVDNKIKAPKVIYNNGIIATEYLIASEADSYDYPAKRRAALRCFIKKAEKNNSK